MNTITDPRLANLLSLTLSPGRPPRVLGALSGGPSAPANTATRQAVTHAQDLANRLRDLNESLLSPSQKDQQARAMSEGTLAKLDAEAKRIEEVKTALKSRMTSASAVAAYGQGAQHFDLVHDMAIVDRLNSMPVTQKAATISSLTTKPWENLRLAEAVSRTPPALTGLTMADHDAVRVGLLAVLKKDEFNMLSAEAAQLNDAITVLRGISGALGEVLPSKAALTLHSPTLTRITSEPGLSWGVPQRTLDAVQE